MQNTTMRMGSLRGTNTVQGIPMGGTNTTLQISPGMIDKILNRNCFSFSIRIKVRGVGRYEYLFVSPKETKTEKSHATGSYF